MPVTRARTSTSREPAVCPTYSKATGRDFASTVTALTSAGGMPPPGPPWPPPPFSWPPEGLQAASAGTSASRTICLIRMNISTDLLSGRGRILRPKLGVNVARVTETATRGAQNPLSAADALALAEEPIDLAALQADVAQRPVAQHAQLRAGARLGPGSPDKEQEAHPGQHSAPRRPAQTQSMQPGHARRACKSWACETDCRTRRGVIFFSAPWRESAPRGGKNWD